jgi:ribosomal protein S18 acetylase RimI-like enzyme
MRHRAARPDDVPRLKEIEDLAGESFREVGLAEIADDDEPSQATLAEYQASGRAIVAVDEHDRPIAYALLDDVDGNVHIEQISVDPDFGRQGIGRALLDDIAADASARGVPALTLTTFADVPWNAPYYERCGFRIMLAAEITGGLAAIRAAEAAAGLDRWPRVCMIRQLD